MIVVGLMSGTSLDGISAAVARFTETDGQISASLLSFAQRAYTPDERAQLERAMQSDTAKDYCRLNVELAHWLADAAIRAINEAGLTRRDVSAIASHGHTLWHEPAHSTWQLGSAATIAERTGCAVVSNFRARDIAAGGQGAPLVPMADALLFAHPTNWRALQNLGGIGNVSIVPPYKRSNGDSAAPTMNSPSSSSSPPSPSSAPSAKSASSLSPPLPKPSTSPNYAALDIAAVRAFDTGPGVVLIDAVTRHFHPDLPYDIDGQIARQGHPLNQIVTELLQLEFFLEDPPKSTGRELFTPAFVDRFISSCKEHHATSADMIATAVEFTAQSIADQYHRFMPEPVADVLLSGGGAKNPTLVDAIARALDNPRYRSRGGSAPIVRRFDDEFFDGEAKEAVAFALLGYLHLTGRTGNVPSATGARGARLLGELTPA